MRRLPATAKLNLGLVVGPRREDGRHVVTTVLQRVDLADRVSLAPAEHLSVTGFAGDTLVSRTLVALAGAAGVRAAWAARIFKRIPVASGLGGGSSDAATALRLANETLARRLPPARLDAIAASLGADVPFFLHAGPQLAEGDGTKLTPVELPQDYWAVLVLPSDVAKSTTGAVYGAFDLRDGARGYAQRRSALLSSLDRVRRPRDLARLPPNDLAASPLTAELLAHGAFRADVSGAGPVVYGLFLHRDRAVLAQRALRARGRTWLAAPAWYG